MAQGCSIMIFVIVVQVHCQCQTGFQGILCDRCAIGYISITLSVEVGHDLFLYFKHL